MQIRNGVMRSTRPRGRLAARGGRKEGAGASVRLAAPPPLQRASMGEEPSRFHFLDALRAAAAWLVVWDHVVWQYAPHRSLPVPALATWVHENISQPLGVMKFGWLGVCVFFLISGFVITHVSLRERAPAFAVKRLFRIFPMLAVTLLLAVLLLPHERAEASPLTLLTNLLLVNFWIHPQVILVGVAWTLAIEILFYAFVLASYPLAGRPVLRAALLLAMVAGVIAASRSGGHGFFLFAASAAYLPYLAVGQLLYLVVHARRVDAATGTLLAVAAYGVLLYGLRSIHTQFLPLTNSQLVGFAWALAMFLLFWRLDRGRPPRPWVQWLADTSYTVYLLHGIVGLFLLDLLVPRVGLAAALPLTLAGIVVAVAVLHRHVEKPLLAFGQRVAARWSPR